MEKISVIIPCFNESGSLPILYKRICTASETLSEVEWEIIIIDDGSKDGTLEYARKLAKEEGERVRYCSFSRNFGKEAAIYAGLKMATGDYIAVIDADLQDPPELLPQMYQTVKNEGFDCAAAHRVTRTGEPKIRSFFARGFYRLMGKLSKTNIADGARDYRLMTRRMVDAALELGEYNRFSKGIFGWVGFETKWIPFENVQRVAGETKWSFWKLLLYSIDGMVAFSTLPLMFSSVLGIIFCLISFAFLVYVITKTILFGDPVYGWPSMISIILFIGGIMLFCMGILGQYVAKTYMEVKRRPIYIVKETDENM